MMTYSQAVLLLKAWTPLSPDRRLLYFAARYWLGHETLDTLLAHTQPREINFGKYGCGEELERGHLESHEVRDIVNHVDGCKLRLKSVQPTC